MVTGLPGWALKINYWYISNKQKIKYWTTVFFVVLDAMLILFVVIQGVVYLAKLPQRKQMFDSTVTTAIQWSDIKEKKNPHDAIVTNTHVIPVEGASAVDIITEVRNPNTSWYGKSVVYHWVISGSNQPSETTYLLPGQKRFFTAYNILAAGADALTASDVTLVIESIDWERLTIPERYELPEFPIEGLRLGPVADPELGQTQVSGVITNSNVSTFRDVKVTVVLYRSEQVVGINEQIISRFLSYEEREIDVRWFSSVGSVSAIDAEAIVDNLDMLSTL